jgi:endonuclease YncB( thermonuclease family)
MGVCFSSGKNAADNGSGGGQQQSSALHNPLAYAAAVASAAVSGATGLVQNEVNGPHAASTHHAPAGHPGGFVPDYPPGHRPPQHYDNNGAGGYRPNTTHAQTHTNTGKHPLAPGVKYTVFNAWVTKAPDGDTVTVEYQDPRSGQRVTGRVRVFAVDAPESKQAGGKESGDIARQLLLHTHVTLHVHSTDQYGRLVADVVTANGTDYGRELLRRGGGWHYTAYDKRQELTNIQNEAKRARRGLWAAPNPEAPWEFRKRNRA